MERKLCDNNIQLPTTSDSMNCHYGVSDTNGGPSTIENVEKQQAQEAQSYSTEGSLPSCGSLGGSGVWEPYPLNSPPTMNEVKSRSEALQGFLELVNHQTNRPGEVKARAKADHTKSSREAEVESVSNHQTQSESMADDVLSTDYAKLPRIRDYQDQQWERHYMDLVQFYHREGHCCVPNAYKENPELARWVKRQRYQYKLRRQGVSKSTMLPHRMTALERLGFVWDSHEALWEEQFNELKIFKMLYGHCNVPSVFPANPQLSTWVKRQRRLFRKHSMPKHRFEKLVAFGFDWKTRS